MGQCGRRGIVTEGRAVRPTHGILFPLAQEGIGIHQKHHDSTVASLSAGQSESQTECKVNNASGAANLLLDCDGTTPNNEPHIAVSPPGGHSFTEQRVDTALSHPRNSVFFRAHASGCPSCTRFVGDYESFGYGSDGEANIVWNDMREVFPPLGKYLEFIAYACV